MKGRQRLAVLQSEPSLCWFARTQKFSTLQLCKCRKDLLIGGWTRRRSFICLAVCTDNADEGGPHRCCTLSSLASHSRHISFEQFPSGGYLLNRVAKTVLIDGFSKLWYLRQLQIDNPDHFANFGSLDWKIWRCDATRLVRVQLMFSPCDQPPSWPMKLIKTSKLLTTYRLAVNWLAQDPLEQYINTSTFQRYLCHSNFEHSHSGPWPGTWYACLVIQTEIQLVHCSVDWWITYWQTSKLCKPSIISRYQSEAFFTLLIPFKSYFNSLFPDTDNLFSDVVENTRIHVNSAYCWTIKASKISEGKIHQGKITDHEVEEFMLWVSQETAASVQIL